MISEKSEIKKRLLSDKKATIYMNGNPSHLMLALHPFWELQKFRASFGMKTGFRSNGCFEEKLYTGLADQVDGTEDMFIHVSESTSGSPITQEIKEYFPVESRSYREEAVSPSLPLLNKSSLKELYVHRFTEPWRPYTDQASPMRILVIPGESMPQGNLFLYREFCRNIIGVSKELGAFVQVACSDQDASLFSISSQHELDVGGHNVYCRDKTELIFHILSSTLVIAMASCYSILSSMLCVPTLTIYADDPKDRFKLEDRMLPTYSLIMNDPIASAGGGKTHVHRKLRQIQSQLFSFC